jgi:hypothetical protein
MSEQAANIIEEANGLIEGRDNWDTLWDEIAQFLDPNHDFVYNQTKGEKRMHRLYDGTGIDASETLASALHGMLTNPATQFFGLTTGDPELDDRDSVRKWFEEVTLKMHHVLSGSNFHTEIHPVYKGIVDFGTWVLRMEEDEDNIIRFHSRPIWENAIMENNKDVVDTIYRKFTWSIKKIKDEFGEDVLDKIEDFHEAKTMKDTEELELIHKVCPRPKSERKGRGGKKLPFASIYIITKAKAVIQEGGFKEFPFAVPRWTKVSGEVFGRSPGMKGLPDVKLLNAVMKTTIRGAQKTVDPPLLVPDDGSFRPVRTTPGGLNYYRAGSNDKIEPLMTGARIDFGFQFLDDIRQRVRKTFFVDQLQMKDGPQKTATEVRQLAEEQLRLLGPILGRQERELLKPVIDRLFPIMSRKKMFSAPPAELNGRDFRPEYSSQIAKAVRLVDTDSLMRAVELSAPIIQVQPEVLDNLNGDQWLRHVGKRTGIPQAMFRTQEEVKKIRKERAEIEAENRKIAQDTARAEQIGKAGKTLLEAGEGTGGEAA